MFLYGKKSIIVALVCSIAHGMLFDVSWAMVLRGLTRGSLATRQSLVCRLLPPNPTLRLNTQRRPLIPSFGQKQRIKPAHNLSPAVSSSKKVVISKSTPAQSQGTAAQGKAITQERTSRQSLKMRQWLHAMRQNQAALARGEAFDIASNTGQPAQLIMQPNALLSTPSLNLQPGPIASGQSAADPSRVTNNQQSEVLSQIIALIEQNNNAQGKPEYPQVHNQLWKLLQEVNDQGFAVGLFEKSVLDDLHMLPQSQLKQIQDQSLVPAINDAVESLRAYSNNMPVVSLAGLPGKFVPVIYKYHGPILPNPWLEIIRAHSQKSSREPLSLDRSQIFIQPLGLLLAAERSHDSSAHKQANKQLNAIEITQKMHEPILDDGNEHRSGHDNESNNKHKQGVQDNARTSNGQTHNNDKRKTGSLGNGVRSLGSAGSLEDDNEQEEVEKRSEEVLPAAPSSLNPDSDSDDQENNHPMSPSHSRGSNGSAQRAIVLTPEELAIKHYGISIEQALVARAALLLEWAGESLYLKKTFKDYNAVLEKYDELNTVEMSSSYVDLSKRIHAIVHSVRLSVMQKEGLL